jgi:hypothetical protein
VNGVEVGRNGSEVTLSGRQTVSVRLRVAAFLDPVPRDDIRNMSPDEKPYWDIERARVGTSRDVPVELVVNGNVVASRNVPADGQVREVTFDVTLDRSSWIAARILRSSHTNPVFALVDGKPVRAAQRGMVPHGRQPMLDAEGAAHQARGAGGRARRVRPRARGVHAPRRGIGSTVGRYCDLISR